MNSLITSSAVNLTIPLGLILTVVYNIFNGRISDEQECLDKRALPARIVTVSKHCCSYLLEHSNERLFHGHHGRAWGFNLQVHGQPRELAHVLIASNTDLPHYQGEIQLDLLQGQWYFTDRPVGRYTSVVRLVSFCDSTGVILERVPWPFCLGFPKLPAVRYESWNASMGMDKDLGIWIKFSCTPEVIQLTA